MGTVSQRGFDDPPAGSPRQNSIYNCIYYPAFAGSEPSVICVSHRSTCRCVGVQPGAGAQDDTRNTRDIFVYTDL